MNTDYPLSFYAATKKSNELMAHSYSNIYGLPCTALRFFTVYGPYGRPDMSLFLFTKSIIKNKKISLFNNGNHERDFTFIDDIIAGIIPVILKPSTKKIPFNCFNIGASKPTNLKYFLNLIETKLQKKSKVKNLPMQPGDVKKTYASVSLLSKYISFKPKTNLKNGINIFIDWYKKYYNIK